MSERQCHGTKKNGQPCGAAPKKGKDFCWQHNQADIAEPDRHTPGSSDVSDASGARAARGRDWDRAAFLECFRYSNMVAEACRMVGIARSTAYLERERNEEFAAAMDEIDAEVTEKLEAEAFRRAHDGVDKMIVSAGQTFGTEKVYSDALIQFLLKARRPEKYRERVDVAHSGGTSVTVKRRTDLSRLSDEQLRALEEIEDALDGDG